MIRVLLADDQAVIRAGFRVILELAGDIEVVGEASDGPAAVTLSRRLAPDVVCMDIRMPNGDGLTATRDVVAGTPSPPAVLVVTTSFDLDEYVFGALEAGAGGIVLKDAEPDDLIAAVRALAAGRGLLDQAVTRRVIAEFARRRPVADLDTTKARLLTAREAEVVRLLAQGLSNAEIADELVIETSTVKAHLGRARTKIGVRDRAQAVVWAYRIGIAPPDGS